jgi:hypothetical protein
MLTPKDKEIINLLINLPDHQMVVESGVICHIGDKIVNNRVDRLVMMMALTEIESQGALTRYELSRTGRMLAKDSEYEHIIFGAL